MPSTPEQIAFGKTNPALQIKARRIFARQRQRVIRDVHGMHFSFRKLRGQGESDDTAAGPDIQDG